MLRLFEQYCDLNFNNCDRNTLDSVCNHFSDCQKKWLCFLWFETTSFTNDLEYTLSHCRFLRREE